MPLELTLGYFIISSSEGFIPAFLSSSSTVVLPSTSIVAGRLVPEFFADTTFISTRMFSMAALTVAFTFSGDRFVGSGLI